MKKTIIIAIALLWKGFVFAQCDDKGISIDPRNPANTEKTSAENNCRYSKADANWQFQNEYKFYSTIIFRKSPGQFLEQLFLNGQFVVNPETWEVEAAYDFGFKSGVGTRYHFKGRKIR